MFTLFKRGPASRLGKDISVLTLGFSIALGLELSSTTLASSPSSATAPIVQTNKGLVEGFWSNGLSEFLGIPYAAPPLGNLRWRPPVAHASWNGVLKTQAYGPTCAQIAELGVYAGPPNSNEDCLYL